MAVINDCVKAKMLLVAALIDPSLAASWALQNTFPSIKRIKQKEKSQIL